MELRLVKIQERQSVNMGVIGTIGVLVAASALMFIGYYVTTKFSSKIETSISAADNVTFQEIKTDLNDAWGMGTLYVWFAVAAGILGLVFATVAIFGR